MVSKTILPVTGGTGSNPVPSALVRGKNPCPPLADRPHRNVRNRKAISHVAETLKFSKKISYVPLIFTTMIICLCGSMQFHQEMRNIKKTLEKAGHTVLIPKGIELMDSIGYLVSKDEGERVKQKIQHDFIKEHFRKIAQADAILVVNLS